MGEEKVLCKPNDPMATDSWVCSLICTVAPFSSLKHDKVAIVKVVYKFKD